MNELEKIQQWLQQFPGWEGALTLEYTEGKPGSAGLFYKGSKEISRQVDLKGDVIACQRMHFEIRCVVADREGSCWLRDLENWVHQQSTQGFVPQLGCYPFGQRVCANGGKLVQVTREGAAVYSLELWAEFMTYMEGWFDDGSGL